jgi:hypothetical protein
MERFAKLFDTPTTQVLVQIDYEEEDKMPHVVSQTCMVVGIKAMMKHRWPEHEGDKATDGFEKYGQEQAEKFVAACLRLGLHDGEPS